MAKPLPDDHHEFGPCIAVRRKGLADRIIWGILIVLVSLIGVVLVPLGIGVAISGELMGLLAAGIGAGLLWIGWISVRALARAVEFYHHGIVSRVFSRTREFPFPGATELTYTLIRRYINGIYSGTALALILKTADGRRLRFSGLHKERPKGLAVTILSKKFEGEDELDVVRDVIATYVAQSLLDSLDRDGTVPWTDAATISHQGVTPTKGRRKHVLSPWSSIAGVGTGRGSFGLFAHGEQKPFLSLATNARNFFPGLEVFKLMMSQHGGMEPVFEPAEPDAGHG